MTIFTALIHYKDYRTEKVLSFTDFESAKRFIDHEDKEKEVSDAYILEHELVDTAS